MKLFILIVLTLVLVGCQTPIKTTELLHHNYILQSVNGIAPPTDLRTLANIEFGEHLFVSGSMCNHFSGFGMLENGILTVKQLNQTRKLCPHQSLNQWDSAINDLLTKGAKISKSQNQLILQNAKYKLIYLQRDWV